MKTNLLNRLLIALAFCLQLSTACAQGTAFTYQGRLVDGGVSAEGVFDFRFVAYDAASGGNAVSSVVTNTATPVTNGIFTVRLDFGAQPFGGSNLWLQISVRTNGGVFLDLSPRQAIASTPYAVRALNATDAATATLANSVAAGSISSAALQSGAVDSTKIADGSVGVADLSVVVLSNTFWRLGGNTGTTPGVNFLGTTDNQPLILSVNGQAAMRYEPTTDAPNVVGGWIGNSVQQGLQGATIGGGGSQVPYNGNPQPNVVASNGYFATIAGGYNNTVQGYGGALLGGSINSVVANFGVIGGGQFHTIDADGVYSVIGGGYGNRIQTNAQAAFIAGGGANVILSDSFAVTIGGGYGNTNGATFSTISGGVNNSIEANNSSATIVGGQQNVIRENVSFGFIGGGSVNSIQSGSGYSVIAGGQQNIVETNAGFSVIGGGLLNVIESFADQSVVAGGNANEIRNSARESFIGGGFANVIQTNALVSFIGGGSGNNVLNPFGTIGGGIANRIAGNVATIGGGQANTISNQFATIGGGMQNTNTGNYATVGGGFQNISSNSYATVGGGYQNVAGGNVNNTGDSATVAGGYQNASLGNNAFVGGGFANQARGDNSAIAGGWLHTNLTGFGFIGGGQQNLLEAFSRFSVVGGGDNNTVRSNSPYSIVAGGQLNRVGTNANFATIPGGSSNEVNSPYGFASGRRAKSKHQGAFVWADSTDADFASTATNQFSVRAGGGVRLETGGAGFTLDGLAVLAGSVNTSQITDSAVTTAKIADGAIGLADLAPAVANNTFWRLGGNAATTPGVNFVGTADNQPLEIKVNGSRALRIEPTASGTPNIIAGAGANAISSGVSGATVGGGLMNTIGSASAFANIGGGQFNLIGPDSNESTVGGGYRNTIETFDSTIAGGAVNTIQTNGQYSTIAGGTSNRIQAGAQLSTIGGGSGNLIATNAVQSTISGGIVNRIDLSTSSATIGGGESNLVAGIAGTVGGGLSNHSMGRAATIPGGENNLASGQYSFASGRRAIAAHDGAFVWADSQNADFASTGIDQFSIRAAGGLRLSPDTPTLSFEGANTSILFPPTSGANTPMIYLFSSGTANSSRMVLAHSPNFPDWGLQYDDFPDKFHFVSAGTPVMTVDLGFRGVGIGTSAPSSPLEVIGEAKATVFTTTSDRAAKENFKPIDEQEVLAKVAALPVVRWNFKALPGAEHLGPMAQDFNAAFGLGADDKHIATVDADGVALAAIKGLNQKLENQTHALETELKRRDVENAELKVRLAALEQFVARFRAGD